VKSRARFRSFLRSLLQRSRAEREMDLELRLHIESHAEDLVRNGLTPEDALRQARIEFGTLEARKDECREALGLRLTDEIRADLLYAVRRLFQSPGFTATALAVLALGMGATTAVFSVVNAVLLKPIPSPDPDRLVVLMNTLTQGQVAGASPAKFQFWRAQSDVLEDVSAIRAGVMNYTGGEAVEQVQSAQVSADFFRAYGVRLLRGRTFTAAEDLPNGPRVVVIGDAFWLRQFARDPRILGQTISLNGDHYKVIGIREENAAGGEAGAIPDVYVPFRLDPYTRDQGNYFSAVARLKPGVTLVQAQARLQRSAEEYAARFPGGLPPHGSFTVIPFRDAAVGPVGTSLLELVGAVGFVLLIACANVANLLLVRAAKRRREIGIRIAIGAGRARIVRQLLAESVLLSLAGGALGLALGFTGIRALLAVNTAGLPRVGLNGSEVHLDWRVLSFTILISAITGVVFGLIPALHGSRADVNGVLKDDAGRSGTNYRQSQALSFLVVGEVSLAVILLVGSVLLIRTSIRLHAVDPGFDAKNILILRMSVTGPDLQTSAGVDRMVRDGVDRIRTVPGVVAAGATCCVPLQNGFALRFTVAGWPAARGPMTAAWVSASPGFFDVYKIPLKRGRVFDDRDNAKSPPVALISETMVKLFWKDSGAGNGAPFLNDDPLQDRIVIGRGPMKEFQDEPERQIVGIVGEVHSGGLRNPPAPTVYIPHGQVTDAATALDLQIAPMAWVVRTQGEPHALASAIQEQLRQSSGLPVSGIQSMDEVVSQSTSPLRFTMLLMTVFGSCAVLLAAIGIYGLMAYTVQQRTQEIGIRIALGAGADQVKNVVVFQGMRLALAGVAIGLASAFSLARFIARWLFQIQPHDPLVFIIVPLVLSAVALCAVWFPASRASRIDPIEALRYE
jgi:putative ABC transport system permease protein